MSFQATVVLAFVIMILSVFEAHGEDYIITLKSGKKITTDSYRQAGDMVWYQMFGGEVGLKMNKVAHIRPLKSSKSSSGDEVIIGGNGRVDIPVYYQVVGSSLAFGQKYIGVYEESGLFNDKPIYRKIGSTWNLFYSKKREGWALGEVKYRKESVNLFLKSTSRHPPEKETQWKNRRSSKESPVIRVKRVAPPASVFEGRICYKVSFLPNEECNGVYRPGEIYDGRVRYLHERSSAKLFFSENTRRQSMLGYGRWYISFKNFKQYNSHPENSFTSANEIRDWRTTFSEPVKAAIVITPCN